jgi:hypothetical protein
VRALAAGCDDLAAIRQGLLRLKSIIAAERFSRALYRHYLALKDGYRPDQLRDDHGRWSDEAGSQRPQRTRLAANEGAPLGPRGLARMAVELAQRAIEAYRTDQLMWDMFRQRIGTVSTTEVDGVRYFGSNSTAPSYTDADYREAAAYRDVLVAKYPDIMATNNIGAKPNDAVFHAEANILLRIARDNGGTLAERSIEIHSDRPLCSSCNTALPYIGMELGNPTVTFVGPQGQTRVRDGGWVRP